MLFFFTVCGLSNDKVSQTKPWGNVYGSGRISDEGVSGSIGSLTVISSSAETKSHEYELKLIYNIIKSY